jgi:hypothetical protein
MTDETRETTFHVKDGFQFTRITGGEHHGSVKIAVVKDGAVVYGTMLPPNEWASVAATMSALGETGTTFRMFEAMQR